MWDFYRKKNNENVWVASGKNGKNIDRDSENEHGNVCIITQDTKLVRINDAEEGWAFSKGSKCIQKKNPPTPQKTLDLSQPEKAKGKHTQQQIRMQTSLPDLRPASLRFAPCWLFVVAALGCSEISSQQTTKTDFQQQFVRFLKEGCELNESHCNARTRPHPPHPLLAPNNGATGEPNICQPDAICPMLNGVTSSQKTKSNRRTRGRMGEVEEISFLSHFLSFTLSWSTQIVYSNKGSNTTRLLDWEKKVPDSRCSFRYQTYSE